MGKTRSAHLFRFDHLLYGYQPKVTQNVLVNILPQRNSAESILRPWDAEVETHKDPIFANWQALDFRVQSRDQLDPVLQTNLEDLPFVNLTDFDHI